MNFTNSSSFFSIQYFKELQSKLYKLRKEIEIDMIAHDEYEEINVYFSKTSKTPLCYTFSNDVIDEYNLEKVSVIKMTIKELYIYTFWKESFNLPYMNLIIMLNRKCKKMTKEETANILGIKENTLNLLEWNSKPIKLSISLDSIADALNFSVAEFYLEERFKRLCNEL